MGCNLMLNLLQAECLICKTTFSLQQTISGCRYYPQFYLREIIRG
jgi:hypothetical protein